ncbi:MAG: DNA helicase II [Alphaproteobacteria bacterium]|nr:DNA helicase II [Alphaproteobacteria bacterium]
MLSNAVPAPIEPYPLLASLNPGQQAAVVRTEGAVLVLAGAGTGKTRVLTTRLAYLIATGRTGPFSLLAVTFTNKAAREMAERVAQLLGRPTEGLWIGTFHAIAARILRRHAELVGLKSTFTILDTDDQLRLVKQVLEAANVDDKRWPARGVLGLIERWKDRGLTPDKVPGDDDQAVGPSRAIAIYRAYQQRLIELNAADFGDLLLHGLTLFTGHPDVLAQYQDRFRYILVDEYQDTNVAQYLWLRLLAQSHGNLCCVGDDDQSIYGWRGAQVDNILRFERDFAGATVVRLERNYRSTGHILGAASALIAHNAGRLGKTLWTEAGDGEPVAVRGVWDDAEEARAIGEEIEAGQRAGLPLGAFAILVRAGFQTRAFEERLITLGVPYRVVGGLRFYERQEIRDALAYLRVIAQPDDDLAFERIYNQPKRGLGDTTLQLLHTVARARGCSLLAAAAFAVETDELPPQRRATLRRLIESFARWRQAAETMPAAEIAAVVLDESGYTAMWQQDKLVTAPGRLDNLQELVRAIAEFERLPAFLEHVSLVMDMATGDAQDMVSIMTLHSAKGLEFDTVFLPGWEEGVFPNQLAIDDKGIAGLEEERRLAHVGLTRARRRACVLYAGRRLVHGQWQANLPSRFLAELPAKHVIRQDALGQPLGHAATPGAGHVAESARPGYGLRPSNYHRVLDARAKPAVPLAKPVAQTPEGIAVGGRVFHQKFGYGRVRAVDGDKLDIAFDKAGDKKVMAGFVQKA